MSIYLGFIELPYFGSEQFRQIYLLTVFVFVFVFEAMYLYLYLYLYLNQN